MLNGWFLLVRQGAIQRVGLLDPQFFMYGEDMDWCYRCHRSGGKVVFFAGAEAIHYGGGSSAAAPVQFSLEQYKANWQYWRKHYGWLSQIGFLVAFGVHHGLRIVGSACIYVFSPSSRPETRKKLRRSLGCLQWVSRAGFSQ